MGDADQVDPDLGHVDFVDDPMVADSYPLGIGSSADSGSPERYRIVRESLN